MIWFQRFRERAPPFPTRLKTADEWRAEGFTVETFDEAFMSNNQSNSKHVLVQDLDALVPELWTVGSQGESK
jgi:hypothetical protein